MAGIVWSFLPQPVSVDVAVVSRGLLRVSVDEDGITRIRERYVVSAPLAGQLLRIALEPGDPIVRGKTLLATIKPRDPELLDPRAVAQAEAQVHAAQAAVQRSESALNQARLRQADAEGDFQRAKELAAGNAISTEQLEDVALAFESSNEQLREARHAEDIARFELAQAEAALLRSRPESDPPDATLESVAPPGRPTRRGADDDVATDARSEQPRNVPRKGSNADLDNADEPWDFTIRAPVDGRVLRVFQESAAVVSAGTPLLELGDPQDLEVVVDVLSQDAVKISAGDRVLLEHWGGDRILEGRVARVEPAAFKKISTLGVEEQRVNVIIDLVDPPAARQSLGDGFRVEAQIIVWERPQALVVPTSATFRVGDAWAVFRVRDRRAEQVLVRLGQENGLAAEVLDGLEEGDRVVVHPSDAVADNVAVTLRR